MKSTHTSKHPNRIEASPTRGVSDPDPSDIQHPTFTQTSLFSKKKSRPAFDMISQWLTSIAIAMVALVAGITAVPPGTQLDWVGECRESGFDPDQLACQTCKILPTKFVAMCEKCCQSWLDTKRITKPYAAAILIDRSTGGDVATFLEKDWEELLTAKGTDRLQKLSTTKDQFNFFMARPSQILFFDDLSVLANGKAASDVVSLAKVAVDSYNLDGMKREDIKDMLLTLLP
jgi:hypothetical protein